jgi:hypothetical protein
MASPIDVTPTIWGPEISNGRLVGSKQLTAEEESWDRLAIAIAKVRKAV